MSRPATPPVWKVHIISCNVPPIDWAAMTPTASPSSMALPVAGAAVAESADAHLGVAGEHGAHPDPVHGGVVAQHGDGLVVEDGVTGHDRAVGERDVLGQRSPKSLVSR